MSLRKPSGKKKPHQLQSLTDSFVERVARPRGKNAIYYYDKSRSGFGVKIYPPTKNPKLISKRVYGVRVTIEANKKRWIKIGPHGTEWRADSAREEARQIRENLRLGKVPFAHRGDRKASLYQLKDIATEFFKAFQARVDAGKRSQDTYDKYKKQWDNNVPLTLKTTLVSCLGVSNFQDALDTISKPKGQKPRLIEGNRTLDMLSSMLHWVMKRDVKDRFGLTSNHVRDIDWNAEKKSAGTVMKPSEQHRLLTFLEDPMIRWKTWYEAENRAREEAKLNRIKRPIQKRPHWVVSEAMADALGMLFHSGLRSWEVKAMMWQDIDLESGIVTVLETKKGANPTNEITHKRVSISGEALKILMHIPKTSVWVFPSKGRNKNSASGHIENLQDTWERIRTHLGIQGIRLHDYRHTAATELGKSPSMGPKELQQGMGWETTATAMKYLHTDDAICKNEMEIASEQRMERVRNAPKTGPVTVGDSSKPEVNSKQRKRGKIKNPLAGLSIDLAKGKASNVDSTASRPE